MSGRITTIHLVTHAHVIIAQFGIVTYVRAVRVALRGGTFLEALRLP
jgi:hypothetical protein